MSFFAMSAALEVGHASPFPPTRCAAPPPPCKLGPTGSTFSELCAAALVWAGAGGGGWMLGRRGHACEGMRALS